MNSADGANGTNPPATPPTPPPGPPCAATAPGDGEVTVVVGDETLGDSDPLLAQLLAAATAGAPPAGPAHKRAPIRLACNGDAPKPKGRLFAEQWGFNLHAATRVHGNDQRPINFVKPMKKLQFQNQSRHHRRPPSLATWRQPPLGTSRKFLGGDSFIVPQTSCSEPAQAPSGFMRLLISSTP